MQCLHCGRSETMVTNSAKGGQRVYRERTCRLCGKRFYTTEIIPKASQSYLKSKLVEIRTSKRNML